MTGRVVSLHRWPVKSFVGEDVNVLAVDERGAAGDRAHALYDVFKGEPRVLTARQVGRMLLWRAAYEEDEMTFDDLPWPVLTAPDDRVFSWEDPALPGALADDLGRAVTLRRDAALMPDLPRSLLVTFAASHRAVEQALGPLDPVRWRTNVHIEADTAPFAENGWEGAELGIGAARLRIVQLCERCVMPTRDPLTGRKQPELLRWLHAEQNAVFGVYVRALGPARIAVGDPVTLNAT